MVPRVIALVTITQKVTPGTSNSAKYFALPVTLALPSTRLSGSLFLSIPIWWVFNV
jgi:hypothetical protein